MSDNRRESPPPKPAQDWFDEIGAKITDWLAPLLNPPAPVPIPVRPGRRRR